MSGHTSSPNPTRRRLAYVVSSLDPGGTERLVIDRSLALSSENDVFVYCLDTPGLWAASLRQEGIPVYCAWRQPALDISMVYWLARSFRDNNIDVIHAHQCTPWFYSALSRLIYSRPRLILEELGRFFPEPDKPFRRLINRYVISKLTDRFVAVSGDVRDRLVRYEGLDRDQIEVIYTGATESRDLTETERLELRREWGFTPDDFVVGTVGRQDPIKNLPMLVEAFAGCAIKMPQLGGLVVGDGPEADNLKRLVERKGLADRIRLTGFHEDARKMVECMDLFVLCSLSEGTSMALLEAMAAGVPVVVTDVGGNPEVVEDGVSGRVIASRDAEALAAAIASTPNSDSVERMAAAGKERFQQNFSFSAMLGKFQSIYEDLYPIPHGRHVDES